MRTESSYERGFTLLEVLIAIVILSVGILATTKMQLSFMQSNAKARIMTEGSARTQEIIEELMSRPYDDALLTSGAHNTTRDTNPVYTFLWNVAVNVPAGLKTVNVIVQWPDEKNIQRQVAYTFVKADM